MNSIELQKQFPEIYQEFFFKCQRVASAPHSFLWTGDFSGFYGGLTILSKLPLRFYVGLEQIGSDKFEINDKFQAYFPAQKKFKDIKIESHITRELADILKNKFKGYRMHFLSELTLGLSLGGLGAIAASIAELADKEANFDDKFKIAKTIVAQIQTGRTSAATAYCALSQSRYPAVFYQSGAKSWGKSLDELAELPKNPVWPFDFGLIFSGNLVQGAAVITSAEQIKRISTKRQKEISDLIGEESGNFWGDYLKMLDQVSKQTLLEMVEVFKTGGVDENLRKFFESLNQYQNLLHYLEISTSNIDKIYSSIHRLSDKSENRVGSGCKITGVGKGGEVLFAVPFGKYRETIENSIQKIGNDLSLDYASWSGGQDVEKAKIEQNLDINLFHDLAKKAKYTASIYTKNGVSKLLLSDHDVKADLVLDLINSKIIYKGKSVTSQQIPSQKAAAQILSNLLKTEKRVLKSSACGKYGKSRYDLQGKIALPISKITGLKFEISGDIYDNFSITLKPFDLKIAVIEYLK